MRTLVRELIDDRSGSRWPTSTLDLLFGATLDGLWGEIFDSQPRLTSKLETLTPTAPGYLDLRLVADGGQLSERFHRVQKLTRDGISYNEGHERDVSIEGSTRITGDDYSWWVWGDQLWMIPLSSSGTVELRYSWLPRSWGSLSDGSQVPWPDTNEEAVAFKVAQRCLMKGSTEESETFAREAEQALQRTKTSIRHHGPGPAMIYLEDSPAAWGST